MERKLAARGSMYKEEGYCRLRKAPVAGVVYIKRMIGDNVSGRGPLLSEPG